jgi:ribosomal subunit interface protein
MQLEVTFRNTRARDEIRRRAEALFGKLERFLDETSEGTCAISTEHGAMRVEIGVSAHGQAHHAHDEDEDLQTALDRAFHTIELSLRRAKDKRVDRKRRGHTDEVDGFGTEEADAV